MLSSHLLNKQSDKKEIEEEFITKKKSIAFVLFTLFLSVLILSTGQQAYANENDYVQDENKGEAGNPDGTVTIIRVYRFRRGCDDSG